MRRLTKSIALLFCIIFLPQFKCPFSPAITKKAAQAAAELPVIKMGKWIPKFLVSTAKGSKVLPVAIKVEKYILASPNGEYFTHQVGSMASQSDGKYQIFSPNSEHSIMAGITLLITDGTFNSELASLLKGYNSYSNDKKSHYSDESFNDFLKSNNIRYASMESGKITITKFFPDSTRVTFQVDRKDFENVHEHTRKEKDIQIYAMDYDFPKVFRGRQGERITFPSIVSPHTPGRDDRTPKGDEINSQYKFKERYLKSNSMLGVENVHVVPSPNQIRIDCSWDTNLENAQTAVLWVRINENRILTKVYSIKNMRLKIKNSRYIFQPVLPIEEFSFSKGTRLIEEKSNLINPILGMFDNNGRLLNISNTFVKRSIFVDSNGFARLSNK